MAAKKIRRPAAKASEKTKPASPARAPVPPETEPMAPDSASPAAIQPHHPGPPVAGIGASAGGLDAFKKFFAAMPADSGVSFVVIPHLDPKHESLMVELLARCTTMPVVEAADGMPVLANHVYVLPPYPLNR